MSYLENSTAQKQRDILQYRAGMIHAASPEALKLIDDQTLQSLRDACPEKLAPVVIKSVKHGVLAGYAMQKLGGGSLRVLVTGDPWRIIRVRKKSKVDFVPEGPAFTDLVTKQNAFYTALEEVTCATPRNVRSKAKTQRWLRAQNTETEVSHRRSVQRHLGRHPAG